MPLYISFEVGEATPILDPATSGPVAAIEDGRATIRAVAAPDVTVTKVREELPIRLH